MDPLCCTRSNSTLWRCAETDPSSITHLLIAFDFCQRPRYMRSFLEVFSNIFFSSHSQIPIGSCQICLYVHSSCFLICCLVLICVELLFSHDLIGSCQICVYVRSFCFLICCLVLICVGLFYFHMTCSHWMHNRLVHVECNAVNAATKNMHIFALLGLDCVWHAWTTSFKCNSTIHMIKARTISSANTKSVDWTSGYATCKNPPMQCTIKRIQVCQKKYRKPFAKLQKIYVFLSKNNISKNLLFRVNLHLVARVNLVAE